MKDEIYISVIGVDRKIHTAKPHSKTTECGIKILSKNVTKKDYKDKFSCYECTF